MTITQAKTKLTAELVEIEGIEQGFIHSAPGSMIGNSIVKNKNKFPYICNNTNKTITLKKGCVIVRANKITNKEISSVTTNENETMTIDLAEFEANPEFRYDVSKILKQNTYLFASTNADLVQTDIVKMNIDTGNNSPIKVRPYRVPLQLRTEVDKSIDDKLKEKWFKDQNISGFFHLVVVAKKDETSGMCVDF